MTSPSVLPDTWHTSTGDRVEILTTAGARDVFYWVVKRDGIVIAHSRTGHRKRAKAIAEAKEHFPIPWRTS